MKQLVVLLSVIALFTVKASAQQEAQIKKEAQHFADATVKGDFNTMTAYIYPQIVKNYGGKDSLQKGYQRAMKALQSRGMQFKSITIGTPGKVSQYGNRLFCLLEEYIVMGGNGNTIRSGAGILAVSEDKGRHWYFINSGDDKLLYKMFPEIKGKITIPTTLAPGTGTVK